MKNLRCHNARYGGQDRMHASHPIIPETIPFVLFYRFLIEADISIQPVFHPTERSTTIEGSKHQMPAWHANSQVQASALGPASCLALIQVMGPHYHNGASPSAQHPTHPCGKSSHRLLTEISIEDG